MNGTNYFLDTNALIAFFNGNVNVGKLLSNANLISISTISIIEFLVYKNLSQEDKDLMLDFIAEIKVIDIVATNQSLLNSIIEIRKNYNVKLPDAIIAGSCFELNCSLITNDKNFSKIKELAVINY